MPDGEEKIFMGEVKGSIAKEYAGVGGFGYDPIFIPRGMDKTYAELSSEEKDKLSHRAKALFELKKYLQSIKQAMR
jgi:XTP/dITP diphosphohydrolase